MADKLIFESPIKLPASTPTQPEAGDLYFDGTNLKFNNGLSSSIINSSTSSGGVTFFYDDLENGSTSNYTTYDDGASATPVDGTGGSPSTLTISASTSSPLRGTYSLAITKSTANGQGEGVAAAFSVPSGYQVGAKRRIAFLWDGTDSNYVAGELTCYVYDVTNSTLITPSATSLPKAKMLIELSWDSSTASSYRLIFHVAGTGTSAWTVKLDDVTVDPGKVVSGYAGGEYEETSSFTIYGSASNPTPGTNVMYRRTTRDGEYAIVRWEYYQSGAGSSGSGDYLLPIPAGLTINYSKIGKVLPGSNPVGVAGYAKLYNGTHFLGSALVSSSGSYANKVFVNVSNEVTTPTTWGSAFAGLAGSGVQVSVEARIPIAEWAGSGTLNVAQNDVEYVWNSSSTDAADTTSFGYGPQGTAGVMTVTNLTANRAKRVRFQSPIQATDQIWVEVFDSVSGIWMPISANRNGTLSYMEQNGTAYGIYLAGVNSTDVDVNFARYAIATGAFSAAGANWSGVAAGSKWRVVKTKAGSAVGFGAATATQRGLVSGGTVPGIANGSSVASGYIGEVISGTLPSGSNNSTSPTLWANTITLTPGIWEIVFYDASYRSGIPGSGQSASARARIWCSTDSAEIATSSWYHYISNTTNDYESNYAAQFYISVVVNISTTKQYIGQGLLSSIQGAVTNRAEGKFYAKRIG